MLATKAADIFQKNQLNELFKYTSLNLSSEG